MAPAIKLTTGFDLSPYSLNHSAASSSAEPPISPIIIIPIYIHVDKSRNRLDAMANHDDPTYLPFVSGSLVKRSKQSIKFVPLKGSPPIPTQVD